MREPCIGLCVGLSRLGPRFRVSFTKKQNPTLPNLLVTTRVVQVVISPEALLGDVRTRFMHLEDYVMCFYYF